MEIPAPLPEHLLVQPCDAVGAGKTVTSLAKGYTKNTICIGEFKNTLSGIKSYNDKQKEIRDGRVRQGTDSHISN